MTILVDTEEVALEQRCAYWRAAMERLFQARIPASPAAGPFESRLAIHRIGRVRVAEIVCAPMTISSAAKESLPEIVALAVCSGALTVRQDGREWVVRGPAMCLYTNALRSDIVVHALSRVIAVQVPEPEFLDHFPQGSRALARPIPVGEAAPALFVQAGEALVRRRGPLDAPSAKAIGDSILHLLGAVACYAVVDNPQCTHRSREKIERVLRHARTRLHDPVLDVAQIARAVHLSARQVHRLFADEPMSLMQWVLAQRLENCHRELRQRRKVPRSISEIAFDWGFSDQAHFSRAFRRHFGQSPSEVRKNAANAAHETFVVATSLEPFDIALCRGCRFRSSKTSRAGNTP